MWIVGLFKRRWEKELEKRIKAEAKAEREHNERFEAARRQKQAEYDERLRHAPQYGPQLKGETDEAYACRQAEIEHVREVKFGAQGEGVWRTKAAVMIFEKRERPPSFSLPFPADFTGCTLKWYPGYWDSLNKTLSRTEQFFRPGPCHTLGRYLPQSHFESGKLIGTWPTFIGRVGPHAFAKDYLLFSTHYKPEPCDRYPHGWVWDSRMAIYVAVQQDPSEIAAPRPLEPLPKSDTYGDNSAMSHDQLKAMGAAHPMPKGR